MSGKRPITATFTRYVGYNRKPADAAPTAEHYGVRIVALVDGERGTPREVITELSAAQIVMLTRALPTQVLQELTGIDRRQFMRAAGMSNATINHVLGARVAVTAEELADVLQGDPWRGSKEETE